MILSDALKGGDFTHKQPNFRGLIRGMGKTEHVRVACRYGGNGALGDDRDDDPSVHDRRDLRRAAGGRAGWVLRHPQPRCVPGRPERRAVYLVVHPVHGRSHRRHFRGHGGRGRDAAAIARGRGGHDGICIQCA